MIAIEELEKLMVELDEWGYRPDLKIELSRKSATLRCNMKEEDIATLARRTLTEEKTQERKYPRKARPF